MEQKKYNILESKMKFFLFIQNIGFTELLLILGIVLLLFGASKLPKLARSIGESLKEFKKSVKEGTEEENKEKNA